MDNKSIASIYSELRTADRRRVGGMPLQNRLILSQLITHSTADNALRFAWANRSLAQADDQRTSAIMALSGAPEEALLARQASLLLRSKLGMNSPREVKSQVDLSRFITDSRISRLVLKQNYPSENDEYTKARSFNYSGVDFDIANTKQDYDIIESKTCLARLSQRDEGWIRTEIERYIDFVLNKYLPYNNDDQDGVGLMAKLVKAFLIPSRRFKGSASELATSVSDMIEEGFLPVFKFSYSVSGFGVHYPKTKDGTYNTSELRNVLGGGGTLLGYLSRALTKDGQTVSSEELAEEISTQGVVLQKYISGHEHSIGYFKPLLSQASRFSLGLSDFVATDVLVEGTGHAGNVLHYGDDYLAEVLSRTAFKSYPLLLHFAIELILYLMYLDQRRIKSPDEFTSVCVEDFGIQFIVNDDTGDIGLIEFNGRTPSCNLNHYYLLSRFGTSFEAPGKLPSKNIIFTNARIMDARDLCRYADTLDKFVDNIIYKTKARFGDKCGLVSLQTTNGALTVNFAYFLGKDEQVETSLKTVKGFFLNLE